MRFCFPTTRAIRLDWRQANPAATGTHKDGGGAHAAWTAKSSRPWMPMPMARSWPRLCGRLSTHGPSRSAIRRAGAFRLQGLERSVARQTSTPSSLPSGGAFRRLKRRGEEGLIAMNDRSPIRVEETTFERHFTPKQLAELWLLHESTIRRLFLDEPGVLK